MGVILSKAIGGGQTKRISTLAKIVVVYIAWKFWEFLLWKRRNLKNQAAAARMLAERNQGRTEFAVVEQRKADAMKNADVTELR